MRATSKATGSLVLECKNANRFSLSDWLDQALQEAANAGPTTGGGLPPSRRSEVNMGDQYMPMDLDTLARIVGAEDVNKEREEHE